MIKKIFNAFIRGPVFLILFGLIFFGIGAGLTYKQSYLERGGTQASGEVTSLAESCDDDGCSYTPIVRFITLEGNTFSFRSTYSSYPPEYEIGEKVTVIYLPEAPENVVIKGEGTGFRIVFMIVGGIIACVGLGMFSTTVVKIFIKE